MSKKLLIVLMALVVGAFTAPMAMAFSIGGFAWEQDLDFGNTAGTILNPEGKGDALIFQYYDVRQISGRAQDTYFAIINDSSTGTYEDPNGGMAAKLRFREWDKSLEVYDVDIWLSCNDVWVGLITQDVDKSLARLWSPDWVIIAASDSIFTLSKALNVVDPITGALIGRNFRPEVIPIPNSRTLYGYFEVIGEEMTACKASASSTVGRLKTDARNYLSGYAYIVRVDDGVAAGYNAAAIANFSRTLGTLFVGPGATKPDLADCEDTLDQLEFMLSKRFLTQGYSIEANIGALFSAIITFPTKHFHFGGLPNFPINSNSLTYDVGNIAVRGEPFNGTTANAGEEIRVVIWDRNENPFDVPPGFESPPTTQNKVLLLHEVNIVGLYKTTTSPTLTNPRDNQGLPTGTFDSGWFEIDLNGTVQALVEGTHIKILPDGNQKISAFSWFDNYFLEYRGLPVLGLVFQEFFNNQVGGAYGEMLPIFYEVDWRQIVANGG